MNSSKKLLCLLSLTVLFAACGGGSSSPAPDDSGATDIVLSFAQQAYIKGSNTEKADVFGDSVALDGDTLAVGAPFEASIAAGIDGDQNDNSAIAAGAVYVFTRDPSGVWTQQAYIKASNTDLNDDECFVDDGDPLECIPNFGHSVALDGDTLVVGAPTERSGATGIDGNQNDTSAPKSGAVYVFTRDANDVWSQQAYIKASNTDFLDQFGDSVALDGDTLAVGAVGEDSNATGVNGDQSDNSGFNPGAVYVFTRDASDVWSQQAYIKASNTNANHWFGRSVAVAGDTLAVGNSNDVYVFTRDASDVWSQQAYIKASNTDAGDDFGDSIALDGDTLAVGASAEKSNATGIDGDPHDNSAIGSGAAYVFTRDASDVWTQRAYIKASNAEERDFFGYSVALDGDTLAVSAIYEASYATGVDGDQTDNSADNSGAVYVFARDASGVWSQQAYIKASNTETDDWFGHSVALDGDILAVGASREDSNATGVEGDQADNSAFAAGAVYVFE